MDGNQHSGRALVRSQATIRVAIICALMSVFLLLILVFVPSDRTKPSVLVVLLGLALFTAVVLKSRVESPDYFEIIYPISLMYFLSFCVRGAVLIANPADLHPEVNGFSALNKALGFGLLGGISLWLGYYCLSSNPGKCISALANRLLPDEWRADKAITRILFLFIVGISLQTIAIFYAMARASNVGVGLDATYSLFGIFGYLSTIGLVLFSLLVFRRRASEEKMLLIIIVWCGMLLLSTLIGAITGVRGQVLTSLFLIPLFCYNYTRKHVSAKRLVLYTVLLIVVLLVIIMPLVRPFRITLISRSSGSIGEYLKTVRQGSYKQTLGERFSEFSQRQIILENFAIAISKTPDIIPFKNGATFISVASNFIPRFIWSEKVTHDFDLEFSYEYAGWSRNSPGSTGVTNIGELYINFGITGLIIGMFILGLLYRSIYKNLIGTQAVGDLRILVYYFFLSSFIWIEGSLGFLLYQLIIRSLILVAAIFFLRISSEGKKTAQVL